MLPYARTPSLEYRLSSDYLDDYELDSEPSQNTRPSPVLSKNRSVSVMDDPDVQNLYGANPVFRNSLAPGSSFHRPGTNATSRHHSRYPDDLKTRSHISVSSDGPDVTNVSSRRHSRYPDVLKTHSHISISSDGPDVTDVELANFELRKEVTNLKLEVAMLRGQLAGVQYVSIYL
jgi:hypothetical protein